MTGGSAEAGLLFDAADRLAHDLGKGIRFSAPRAAEADTESLRARLAADVLATRRGPDGPLAADEIFERWRAEHGRVVREGAAAEALSAIAAAVARARTLAARIGVASRRELEALDQETVRVAEGCRRLRELARAARGEER